MAVIKISSRACLESNSTRHCSTDAQERTVSKLETLANKLGVPLRFGTLVGKYPQTIILDYNYQDGAVRVSSNGSFEINGEEFGSYDSYFSFSRVNIDDVKDALLSLKAEAGESEESLTESDDVWSTPESAAKSLFDRGLVASDYVERACKRHGKDQNFAYEVGVIISQMVEEDEHLGESKSINEDANDTRSLHKFSQHDAEMQLHGITTNYVKELVDLSKRNGVAIETYDRFKRILDRRGLYCNNYWWELYNSMMNESKSINEDARNKNSHKYFALMSYDFDPESGPDADSFNVIDIGQFSSKKEAEDNWRDILSEDKWTYVTEISEDEYNDRQELIKFYNEHPGYMDYEYYADKGFAQESFSTKNVAKSKSIKESLHESKDIYADSQIRYELEQVLDYLENSAGAFKKILSRNRWNETATDSLVDDMKDCFNRVKKIAYSLDSDRYSMFDGR